MISTSVIIVILLALYGAIHLTYLIIYVVKGIYLESKERIELHTAIYKDIKKQEGKYNGKSKGKANSRNKTAKATAS